VRKFRYCADIKLEHETRGNSNNTEMTLGQAKESELNMTKQEEKYCNADR
jgi:hypothetical protein